ncbi:hypothetical protein Nepgr_006734 [Nepenthes gracilis]|uniref:Uncharacterized protein n=1 Tax=Nepenthes gracilis TaxID=150966 RepID=A0AAD3S5L7_NEPGR|nr:hypothetical protein Nepgr_006734 [Nepenthes gracilis]
MVSDIPMSEVVASAPSSVVAGDCQSALLFVDPESNFAESKLKEECDCSSSGCETVLVMDDPCVGDHVAGSITRPLTILEVATSEDGSKEAHQPSLPSNFHYNQNEGSPGVAPSAVAPGTCYVNPGDAELVSGAVPSVKEAVDSFSNSTLLVPRPVQVHAVIPEVDFVVKPSCDPVAAAHASKLPPISSPALCNRGSSPVIDPDITPESISRIVRQHCSLQSDPAGQISLIYCAPLEVNHPGCRFSMELKTLPCCSLVVYYGYAVIWPANGIDRQRGPSIPVRPSFVPYGIQLFILMWLETDLVSLHGRVFGAAFGMVSS